MFFQPPTISIPEVSISLSVEHILNIQPGNRPQSTETILAESIPRIEKPIGQYKVAAPPKICSVLPKGVSIASKATVPTDQKFTHVNLCFTYICKNKFKK